MIVARLKNVTTGAVVSVRDDKVMGSEWVPVTEAAKAPQRSKKQDPEESK